MPRKKLYENETKKERLARKAAYAREYYHKRKHKAPPSTKIPTEFEVRLKTLEEKMQTLSDIMDMKELFCDLSADFQKLREEVRWGKKK